MDAVHSESPSYPRTMSIGAFRALRESFPPPQVLDVRRNAAFESDPAVIPGSVRCAPEDVGAIAGSLEPWRPVVAVCVYGHEVSRNAATELAARGCDARSLDEGDSAAAATARSSRRAARSKRTVPSPTRAPGPNTQRANCASAASPTRRYTWWRHPPPPAIEPISPP